MSIVWYDLSMNIDDAIRAQIAHTRNWDDLPSGDDDHDYMRSAYQLVVDLLALRMNYLFDEKAGTAELTRRLTDADHADCIAYAYAVDGIAPEIAQLIPESIWD